MTPPRTVLLALLLVACAWTAVIGLWPDAPIGLTFDDSFYYFEIGRRIGLGQGSTFDGLHQTNGYHPLWMLVATVLYLPGWGGDLPVRIVLIVQMVAAITGSWLALRALPWRTLGPLAHYTAGLAVAGWWLVPMVFKAQVNGLESALVVLTHGAVLGLVGATATPLHRWPLPRALGLSGLLALAFLARTDAALLLPLLGLWCLPGALRDGPRALFGLVAPLLLPSLVVLASFAVNQVLFDTPMQVSGTLKRVPPGLIGVAIFAVCAAAGLALAWLARRGQPAALPRLAHLLRRTGWYGVFLLTITAYYLGLQTFARLWYFAPAALWAGVALVALALDLHDKALQDKPDAAPLRAAAPVVLILLLPLAAGAVLTGRQIAAPEALAVRKADRQAAVWVDQRLPPDQRVASWDAGLIGYIAERDIINLDGVVNDVHWLRALRQGTTADILRREQVGWLVNHSVYDGGRCTSIDQAMALLDPSASLEVVQAWPFEQVGSLNGQAYGTHQMAACVVRISRPADP